jgi:Ca2+-binding EF-hand superfamily protein
MRLEAETYFNTMDSDKSGTLDLYQFILALQLSGNHCTSGQYESFFNNVDGDSSGQITLQEWIVAFSHLKRVGVNAAISWSETKRVKVRCTVLIFNH